MEEIRIVASGQALREIGARAFMDFINPFVEEKSFLLMDAPVTMQEEEAWIEGCARELDAKSQIKLILFMEDKIAGTCDLRKGRYKERNNVEIGLAVSKEHRGKGYGEKLLRKGIEIAEREMRPHKLWIKYEEGNVVAKSLYEKAGFVEVARLKEYIDHFGQWKDKIIMEYRRE